MFLEKRDHGIKLTEFYPLDSFDDLLQRMVTNPRRIFSLPAQPDTWVEIDPQAQYTISNRELQTKCGWTPFDGVTVTGRLQRVVLRGQPIFDASPSEIQRRILAEPGSGRIFP